jgi:hypothetical protein
VPLSNNRNSRRIHDIGASVKDILVKRVPIVRYFTLQLDKTADVSYISDLPYIRYKWKGTLLKDILLIGKNMNQFSTFFRY